MWLMAIFPAWGESEAVSTFTVCARSLLIPFGHQHVTGAADKPCPLEIYKAIDDADTSMTKHCDVELMASYAGEDDPGECLGL